MVEVVGFVFSVGPVLACAGGTVVDDRVKVGWLVETTWLLLETSVGKAKFAWVVEAGVGTGRGAKDTDLT